MTTEIKFVLITADELSKLLEEACERAVTKVLANQEDELLNISQICECIPGMTYYLFKNLCKEQKIKSIRGRYSLKRVKTALEST
ncbi:hypothetical protein [Acinetobacter seifertii]|uniref:hypothetical protein n=1 Tax=Acinetobacter seifertii TaxID=1530123 RepID=UPI00168AE9AB|nr:hypothetical protein [Acinetobacter seifertii]QNX34745.1 hypothetical protein IC788_05375 [Acinetobacter seifertii]